MAPVVSLVIAAYNHVNVLPEALESALAQTYPACEVVVVDDGSTDDTPNLLKRYQDKVRTVRQANKGLAAARNRGVSAAQGEYVAFLDADDLLHRTKLAEQVAFLEARPEIGWTYCDVELADQQSGECRLASDRFGYAARRLDGDLFEELVAGNFIPAISPMLRRSLFEQAGAFDESLTALEDWDLWLRLSLIAPAAYLPRVLATYRLFQGGMSQDRTRMDCNRFRVVEKMNRLAGNPLARLGTSGRRLVADMHNWFAYEAYNENNWGEAVERLRLSLRTWPWQGHAPLMLGASIWKRCRHGS
jgi:glycosyltransferase involved in cell wall biosynthesis